MGDKNQRLLERYLREKSNRGYSRATIKNYGKLLRFFLDFLGDRDVTRTDRDDIERYLEYLRNRGSSANKCGLKLVSIKLYLRVASFFLEWLEDNDLILKNPARKVVREIRVEKTKRKALPLEDVRAIVRSARNPRDRAIILTIGIGGLRRSEVANLRVGDVNLKTSEIFVRMGKGKKDRVVVMDEELIEALKVWLIYRESMGPRTDYLFCNLHGTAGLKPGRIYFIVRNAAERAGVKNAFPHRLRHSAATFMHDSGMDILDIKEQLGHESISTTEGYIDANETKRKQGMSRMPSLNAPG